MTYMYIIIEAGFRRNVSGCPIFFREAYRIACLGVTDEDWRILALEALEVNAHHIRLIPRPLQGQKILFSSPSTAWVRD